MNRSTTITLTEQDFIDSQRLYFWTYLRSPRSMAIQAMVGLAVVLIVVGTAWLAGDRILDVVLIAAVGGVAAPIACIALASLVQLLFGTTQARRIFRQQKNLHYTVECSWSEEGYRTRTQRGEGLVPWTDYLKWREGERTLLLYHSERLYQFLPKRFLTPEQITDLTGLLKQAGVRAA